MSDKARFSAHVNSNPKKTSLDDGKDSIDDDCNVDSGIISGQLLSSEQFLSEELDCPQDSGLVPDEDKEDEDDRDLYMRLDSGVDVGLTESFSSLNLRNEKRNDLNSGHTDITKEVPTLNIIEPENEKRPEPEPWQIYFQQDDEGDSQLHIAIFHGMTDAVLALLHMCPHPALLDVRNDSGRAPIHLAVLTQQPHIARRLLIAGAKVNTRDADGNTPLHLACGAGDLASLRALTTPLVATAQPGARSLPQALDQKNYNGETCVHLAAMGGHIDILRHLVWFGANINATENRCGRTALHLAIDRGDLTLLRYLVTECPLVMVGARTYAGRTAFQLGREQLLAAGYTAGPQDNEDDDDYYDSEMDSEDDDDDDFDSEIQYGNSNYFNSCLRSGETINVA